MAPEAQTPQPVEPTAPTAATAQQDTINNLMTQNQALYAELASQNQRIDSMVKRMQELEDIAKTKEIQQQQQTKEDYSRLIREAEEKAANEAKSSRESLEAIAVQLAAAESKIDRMKHETTDSRPTFNPGKLKPNDVKDIKRPEEYDCAPKGFTLWRTRFNDLLVSRHESWGKLLEAIESFKSDKLSSNRVLIERIRRRMRAKEEYNDEQIDEYEEQIDKYQQQLLSYITTYSKGNLLKRAQKTKPVEAFNLYRDVVFKGRGRNKNRLINLKAKVLEPARAKNNAELESILADSYADINTIEEELLDEDGVRTGDWSMSDDTKKTILLKIMQQEHVKYMRDLYNDDTAMAYDEFEQALKDKVLDKEMDDAAIKGQINEVSLPKTRELDGSHPKQDEYVQANVWSDDYQCWMLGYMSSSAINSLAQKRDAADMDDDPAERPEENKRMRKGGEKGGNKGKGKGKGPCWTCGGPHLQRDCSEATKGGGKYSVPTRQAWSSWRPPAFPGPTSQQWRQFFPGNGQKGKSKGKGKGKGKGKLNELQSHQQWWGKGATMQLPSLPPLGQVQNDAGWCDEEEWCGHDDASWDQTWALYGRIGAVLKTKKIARKEIATANRFAEISTDDDEASQEDHHYIEENVDAAPDERSCIDSHCQCSQNTPLRKKRSWRKLPTSSWYSSKGRADAKASSPNVEALKTTRSSATMFPGAIQGLGDGETPSGTCALALHSARTATPLLSGVEAIIYNKQRSIGERVKLGRNTNCEDATVQDKEKPAVKTTGTAEGRVRVTQGKELATDELASTRPKIIAGLNAIDEDSDEWKARADFIRSQCRAELDAEVAAGETPLLFHERSIKALAQTKTIEQGWQILSIAIDSGAAETVIPYKLIKGHPVYETQASRSGLNYASATGDPIPNLGEQHVPMCTREGTLRSMVFQAAPVTQALGSVKRICQSGHRVVFDTGGSYIENRQTGEINMLREEDGNYILDAWVLPNSNPGFPGQP